MSRLLLIVEADAYGIPLQNAKVYCFKHGATNVNAPFGTPTGLGLSGDTWNDPDTTNPLNKLSSSGSPLVITTDNTGQAYVWMDSSNVVDLVITDNAHAAFPLGQPAAVSTFNNYMRVVLPVPQASTTTLPSAVDFKVTWDGTTAVASTARIGGSSVSGSSFGGVVNQILADNSKLGPAGSENLGTPGVTIQLINIQSNNAAVGVLSADYIGKPWAAGIAGTCTNGAAVLSDPGANFPADMVGRLVYVRLAQSATKDYHGVVVSRDSATQITLDRNFGVSFVGNAQWTSPITLGAHIFGQGGGTRGQGNGHPDDGTLTLQAQGAGWLNKALVDFRNAPDWTHQGFGSELFEIHEISLDANKLADYALCGMGVGTGNAATCSDYNAQGGVVANVGIGNHFDSGGSSDVFHEHFVSQNPGSTKTTTTTGGGQALPTASLLVTSTAAFQVEGYLEAPTPTGGTQLLHYTSKDATHFLGVIGGTGTIASGATVKQWSYGFEVTMGDVYIITDFNIATGSHAMLINQSGGAVCQVGSGHMGGGGGGGAVMTVAYCNQLTLGPRLYIDNIVGSDVGGLWVCPMTNTGVTQILIEKTVKFNVNDASFPIVLDGANGGSGADFQLSGFTNGNLVASNGTLNGSQALPPGGGSLLMSGGPGGGNPTDDYNAAGWVSVPTDRGTHEIIRYTSKDATHLLGCTGGATGSTATAGGTVRQATIFVYLKNNWPANRGVSIDHWQGRNTIGVWVSDNATAPDYIGPDIVLTDASAGTSWFATSWKMIGAPTSGRPSPRSAGEGSLFYDQTFKRFQYSDNDNWWPVHVGRYGTVAGTAGAAAIDAALGDHFLVTQGNLGGYTMQNPSHSQAGMKLHVEVFNTSGGAIATTWGVAFILTNGAWVDPANNKKRNITFRYNGTSWIEFSRCTADY